MSHLPYAPALTFRWKLIRYITQYFFCSSLAGLWQFFVSLVYDRVYLLHCQGRKDDLQFVNRSTLT